MHSKIVLPLINAKAAEIGPDKIVWSTLLTELTEHEQILGNTELLRFLLRTKGSHLKTLYLQQIEWNEEWTSQIQSKRLENMMDIDWINLNPDPALKLHTPYIVRKLYEQHNQINQRVRCHRISILDGEFTAPVLPTMEQNQRQLQQQYLGGLELDDEDPAVMMTDDEFVCTHARFL